MMHESLKSGRSVVAWSCSRIYCLEKFKTLETCIVRFSLDVAMHAWVPEI